MNILGVRWRNLLIQYATLKRNPGFCNAIVEELEKHI